MKQTLLFFFLLFYSGICAAQNTDSLLQAIAQMPEDTNKVMAYRSLYRSYYSKDEPAQMLSTAEKGLQLSRQLNFERGVDFFLFYIATALDIQGRGKEAIPFFTEGLQMAEKNKDPKAVANYHTNLGAAYYGMGSLDKALNHYLSAYTVFKALNMDENLSRVLNNIGIIYRTQDKYARAEAIYKESLSIKERLGDSLGMAASYQNLASLPDAGKRAPEMLGYLNKALQLYERMGRDNDAAGCYASLAQIQINQGKYPEAKKALQKAKQQFANQPNVEYSVSVFRLLGTIALYEKQYQDAETNFQEAAKWARQFGQQERLWDVLNQLSQAQQLQGKNAAAYASLREAFALRDTVALRDRNAALAEMQTKFDVVQKDNQIQLNQITLHQRTLERNWILGLAALLALLSLAIFFGLRQRLRANKKIAAQEMELQEQKLLQVQQSARMSALQAMIEGQEKERSRIANDLHDSLGGLLAALKAHFNALPAAPEADKALYTKTNQMIDNAAVEVRRIAQNMMPRALELSGLTGALEDLAQDLNRQGILCHLEMMGLDAPIEPAKAVMLYRIIQELSYNAVKHAQAKNLLIQLIRKDSSLTIIVEDNGRGFDVAKALQQTGLGLSSIQSRVQFLGGTVEWDSVPGEGTTVVLVGC